MDRRKFIKSCIFAGAGLGCAGAFGCRSLIYKDGNIPLKEYENIMYPQSVPYIPVVEFHLAEHCNLNCKYCSHFSPLAEKEFYDFDIFKKDLTRLLKITGGKVSVLSLLGGEPLLNPRITEYFEISRKLFPSSMIFLSTNSLLLKSRNDEFWESMGKNEIRLQANYYPGSNINWDEIISKTDKFNVKYCRFTTCTDFTKEVIESNKVTSFMNVSLDENGPSDYVSKYINCTQCIMCAQLTKGGKLYPCYLPAYIRHLNKKFGTKFKLSKADYLDIYKVKNIDEIVRFLKTPKPFCKYCTEPVWLPWGRTKYHDISEWVKRRIE